MSDPSTKPTTALAAASRPTSQPIVAPVAPSSTSNEPPQLTAPPVRKPSGGGWLLALGLIGVGIGAYWLAGSGGFVGRDLELVTRNPHIRTLTPTEIPFGAPVGSWLAGAPLAAYSLAQNYANAALQPAGYHYTNLVLHVLSALFLFGLVRRALLSPRWSERFASRAPRIAFAVALLWLVHPLAAEAVYSVSARPIVLSGFFTLAALYFFHRTAEARRSWFWGLLTLLCAAATPLTISRAYVLPIVLLLYDRTFAGGSFAAALGRRWLLHVLLFLTLTIPLQQSLSGVLVSADAPPPTTGAMLAAGSLLPGHLAQLTLAPLPIAAVYDDFFANPSAVLRWSFWALLALVALLAVQGLWRNSITGFLLAALLLFSTHAVFFGGALEAVGETVLNYLAATTTIALLVAFAVRFWPRRMAALLPLVTLAAASGLGYLTFQRGTVFKDNGAYWADAIAKRPQSITAHHGRADAFVAEKNFGEAIAVLQKAAERDAKNPRVHIHLADVLGKNRDTYNATKSLRTAEELAGNQFHYLRKIERVFLDLKLYDDALRLLKDHLERMWDDPPVHLMMAELCDALNKPKEQMQHLEEAVKKAPRSAMAQCRLGLRRSRDNLTQDAKKLLDGAIRLNPAYAEAHFALGQNALQAEKPQDAIAPFEMARRLEPDNPLVHYYLGLAHHMTQQTREAVASYQRALELKSDMMPCLNNVAWILATDPDETIRNPELATGFAQKLHDSGGHNIPGYLDTLAAAYASAGRFEDAVAKAQLAVDLLTRVSDEKSAEPIKTRLDLYKKNEPYREPVAAKGN